MKQDKLTMSRREFLRTSAFAISGICLAACAPASSRASTPVAQASTNYYLANKARILKDMDPLVKQIHKFTAQAHGEALAAVIVAETEQGLEHLLPQLSYIGGDKNSLTDTLCQSAGALAFYQAMKAHGKSVDETGKIVYRTVEAIAFHADVFSGVGSRMAQGKSAQNDFKRMAAESQKRVYAGDWVLTFVEGDGESFDFGVDYTECGIVKFYRAQGADEFAPYLCLGDFPISKALNTGLVRTTTLARGGPRCDFRYRSGRPIQMEWTPDFMKE